MKLKFINGNTASIEGLTPDSIGATPYSAYENLASRTTGVENQLAQAQSDIAGLNTYTNYINGRFADLDSADVKLSNIAQDFNTGDLTLNAGTKINGLLSVNPKLEVRNQYTGGLYYPWSESTKHSVRIDMWSDDVTREHEISVFRDTNCTNAKAGLAIYKADKSNTINCFISAKGSSYICADNGWFGVGTNNPFDRFHVANGFIRCSSGLRLGANANSVTYAAAAPTSGSWLRGDIVHNTAPSTGGFAGWICVLGGTPGTWKTWGAISA